jgi:hypothetical protein
MLGSPMFVNKDFKKKKKVNPSMRAEFYYGGFKYYNLVFGIWYAFGDLSIHIYAN